MSGNTTGGGASVSLRNVSRQFRDVLAVDRVSLEIPKGSFFSLLGPSGCGKSTTLRIISGFEIPDSGDVFIAGKEVTKLDARYRPTAMVFQSYALFPHMTVGENVDYGLKVRKIKASERRKLVLEALARVEMVDFVDTGVTQLSGGQQQRTAVARAIAIEPDVILFDEPLSNLDVTLRQQTRLELKAVQHRLGLTSIYVTHDQEEALALSDLIALMRSGRIVQVGSPRMLYQSPETAFVASFLGGSNIVAEPSEAQRLGGKAIADGQAIAIRPEHIVLHENGSHAGRVVSRQFLGMTTELKLNTEGVVLSVKTTEKVPDSDSLRFNILDSRIVSNDL